MREFFRGWRRKIGVATLLMALIFTGGLVRSFSIGDRVTIFTGDLTGETIRSANCYLEWASWKTSRNPGLGLAAPSSFVEWDRYPLGQDDPHPGEDDGIEYRFRCLVFGIGRTSGGSMSLAFAHRILFLSYWAIVIPLMLLSAYLLLTKSRSSSTKESSESIPTNVFPNRRRQAGLVTLVLTCVFLGAWVRSFQSADRFGVSEEIHRRMHFWESMNGSIRWICFKLPDSLAETDAEGDETDGKNAEAEAEGEVVEPTYHGWQVISRSKPVHFVSDDHADSGVRLRFRFLGFGGGDIVSIEGFKSVPGTLWFVPYWSIVIPLSLISIWLLLTNPRKSTPMKTAEPTNVTGS